jgi:8-oxo-dGTP diphosphatase
MTEDPPMQGLEDATLCFLLRGMQIRTFWRTTFQPTSILLGHKKRGFGVDKWAGIGGRIEVGEGVVEAACREVCEEIGVTISESALQARGVITFRFPHRPSWNQTVHLFVATEWDGEPSESEEMRPAWYAPDALPFDQMWDDARYWLPQLIAGETLYLLITFGEDNATVSGVVENSMNSTI